MKEDGADGICASMILNHEQPPCYRDADWQVAAAPENVLVLHTLCVGPGVRRAGHRPGDGAVCAFARAGDGHARRAAGHLRGQRPGARALYAGLGFHLAGRADVLHEGVIPETLVLFEKEV